MQHELVTRAFAYHAHKNTTRKGSGIPYITHPLSVATILMHYNASDELIAAALLHDVVEDENVSFEELEAKFGEKVSLLVKSVSEPAVLREKHPDRKKTWKERKQLSFRFKIYVLHILSTKLNIIVDIREFQS